MKLNKKNIINSIIVFLFLFIFVIISHIASIQKISQDQAKQIQEIIDQELPEQVYYVENGYAYAALSDKDIKTISKNVVEQFDETNVLSEEEKIQLVEDVSIETITKLENDSIETPIQINRQLSNTELQQIENYLQENITNYLSEQDSQTVLTKTDIENIIYESFQNISDNSNLQSIINQIVSSYIDQKTTNLTSESLLNDTNFIYALKKILGSDIDNINIVETNTGYCFTLYGKDITLNHGKDGIDGKDGQNGIGITDISLISEENGVSTYQITYGENDETVNFIINNNGNSNSSGTNGKDGYTPIFGVDYFTDEQIEEISTDITKTVINTIRPIFNASNFSASRTYLKGEYVFYNDTLYQANKNINTGLFNENDWTVVNFLYRLDIIQNALNLVEYNPYSVYQTGDFILYQDELYRCKEDITIAETWNSTKWEKVSISEVLSDLDRKTTELDFALSEYKVTNDETVFNISSDLSIAKFDIVTLYSNYSDLLTTVSALSDVVNLNKENIDALNNSIENINNTLSTHKETLKGIGINTEAITNLSTSLETNYYSKLEIDELLTNLPTSGTVDLTDYYTKDDIDTMVSELEETISTSGTGTTTIETVNSIDLSAVDVLLNTSEEPIVDANTYDLSDSINNYAMIMVAVKTNITAEGDSDEVRTTLIPKAMYYPNINEGGKAFSLGTDTNYISWTFNSESPNTITVEDTANAGLIAVYGIKSDNISNVEITANNSEKPNNNARGRASILPVFDVSCKSSSNTSYSYDSNTHKLNFKINDTSASSGAIVHLDTPILYLADYEKIIINLDSISVDDNARVYVNFFTSTTSDGLVPFKRNVYYISEDSNDKYIEVDIPDWNGKYGIEIGLIGRSVKEYTSADNALLASGHVVVNDIQLVGKDGRIHSLVTKDETLNKNLRTTGNIYNEGKASVTSDYNKLLLLDDTVDNYECHYILYTNYKINFDNISEITLDIANLNLPDGFSLLVSASPDTITDSDTDFILSSGKIWEYSKNVENSTANINVSGITGNKYLAIILASYDSELGYINEPIGPASVELRGVYLTQKESVDTKLYNIIVYGLDQLGYTDVNNSIVTSISDSLGWDSSTISKSVDGNTYTLTESEMNQLLTEIKKYSDSDNDGNDDYGMWAYVGQNTLPTDFETKIWGDHTNTNLAEEYLANNIWWFESSGNSSYIATLKHDDNFVSAKDVVMIGLKTNSAYAKPYKNDGSLKSCTDTKIETGGNQWQSSNFLINKNTTTYYGDDLLAFNSVDDFARWRDTGKPYKLKGTTYNTGDLTISKNIVTQTVNQSTNNNTTGSGSNSGSNDSSGSYIPVEVNLSNYYTKTEIETLINDATKGDTSTIANSLGQATCKLLLDATDSPITAKGTYDLNDSIDNYDWLLVGGWAYNSGSNHEQWVTSLIPKDQFYVQPVGSELQFILNGSISTANRRIAFQFKEDTPNKINVTYKDGAAICRVYGIKNVAYDFQKLNQDVLSDIGSLDVGNIQNASELIVVGSYEYTGSVPGYTGTHFSNGRTSKFSFSIPIAEILDGSDFSYSTYLYEDSGIHLLFNYTDGKLNYVTNKSTGLQNIKILSVYATGRSEGSSGSVDLSNYYNKTEIDALLENTSTPDLSDYYSKTEIDDLLTSVREQITNTIPMPNAFGNMTCEVLLNAEDNPIITAGEHQLSANINDYDYLLVYGWAYVSGSTHEQRISLIIPKALYYKHGESSLDNFDWLLEGGHATETRRICFAFDENNPDKLYVGKREVAGISSIYGLKHVEQNTEIDLSNFYTKDEVNELIMNMNQNNTSTCSHDLIELSNQTALVGENITIGDISSYDEIKIVGSFKYNGAIAEVKGDPTYAGQVVKYSFSIPAIDIIDGSDFIHSEYVHTNAGINLVFNYYDGVLKLKSEQSIYFYDTNVLKVYGE